MPGSLVVSLRAEGENSLSSSQPYLLPVVRGIDKAMVALSQSLAQLPVLQHPLLRANPRVKGPKGRGMAHENNRA